MVRYSIYDNTDLQLHYTIVSPAPRLKNFCNSFHTYRACCDPIVNWTSRAMVETAALEQHCDLTLVQVIGHSTTPAVSPRIGVFLIASLVMLFQKHRLPCLSTTPQKYIQSKWHTWFIRNTERRWNLSWWPKERVLMPKSNSVRERGIKNGSYQLGLST